MHFHFFGTRCDLFVVFPANVDHPIPTGFEGQSSTLTCAIGMTTWILVSLLPICFGILTALLVVLRPTADLSGHLCVTLVNGTPVNHGWIESLQRRSFHATVMLNPVPKQ